MTFTELETLFLTKHPDGTIWQTTATNRSRYCINIAYKPNGKVYTYIVANYADLVNRLQLTDKNLIYKHDADNIKRRIADLQAEINRGYFEDDTGFFGGEGEKICYNEADIRRMQIELEYLTNKINNAIII